MRIVLVDDHAIFRQGLRSLLEQKCWVEVVGEAADGREAIALVEKLKPDVVIMDIAMSGLNGLEALLQLKNIHPSVKVIILTMHTDDHYVFRALRYGASGYVYKGSTYEDLEMALRALQKNETFLSPAVSQVLIDGFLQNQLRPDEQHNLIELLSPREREILQLVAEGNKRRQIAKMLSISVKTVDRHKYNIKEKLKLHREEELADFAKMLGLTGL
ncbi:MAG: response regulator transcription factor [Firmicutes bacterium]|jgi:DNA-binding NarL/FixJ family response regulator|nr:response regulator transcription factor [Bacillota bacterium]